MLSEAHTEDSLAVGRGHDVASVDKAPLGLGVKSEIGDIGIEQ